MVTHGARGVTDVVRVTTDLAKEPAMIQGRQFRLRELNVAPDGIVPWHSHNQAPRTGGRTTASCPRSSSRWTSSRSPTR